MLQKKVKPLDTYKHMRSILLTLTLTLALASQAQVTIGSDQSPDINALLDLKEKDDQLSTKGLLLPRVNLESTTLSSPLSEHVTGMTVYNMQSKGDVTPGYYINDGTKWMRLATDESVATPNFFYMPPMLLPTDTQDQSYNSSTGTFTIDLYKNYRDQFTLSVSSSSAKDPQAGALPVLGSNNLEYFITYYDSAVFTNVKVSSAGILTYGLVASYTVTEKTFMNIIFKVK